jgi:hypothetical protein
MEVIGKTKDSFLISATESEIKEIVSAVTGSKPKEIEIGQKIPAIDYSSTITKVKTLRNCEHLNDLNKRAKYFTKKLDDLNEAIDKASEIDI